MIKTAGWFLVVHGIICLIGAFFPFYPPVFFFYWFFPVANFAIQLIIVLVAGASQLVCGGYLLLRKRWQVRWYWLVIIAVGIVGLLLIYPTLEGLFK